MTDADILQELKNIRQELTSIRQLTSKSVNAQIEAETEIPEKIRRFLMYWHDVHDVMKMYQEVGQEAPSHVKGEVLRCEDRYRQLLNDLHSDTGAFEKVRQEMAEDPENRWDHTRQLGKPKGVGHETRSGEKRNGG